MSNITIEANYKGMLQQHCQNRNLERPVYETIQRGPANAPSWMVIVKYGGVTYTTPSPIPGGKRFAEQMAARQILESIASRQEAFLAGEPLDKIIDKAGPVYSGMKTARTALAEPLHVPVEAITSALNTANHRLSELRRDRRYRDSRESGAFARTLANLTMQIVRTTASRTPFEAKTNG